MSAATKSPTTRMSAEDRRELVLEAAARAFARAGFAGTSTDAVAKEADVSQPYVVRIFGTKRDLFVEVVDRACGQVRETFQAVIDEGPFDPESDDDWARMAIAYSELVINERDVLQVMMHGFAAGDDPEIGAHARSNMGAIFEVILQTGCDDDRAREFIAQGMLLNVMLSMNAPEHLGDGDAMARLSVCAFGDMLDLIDDQQP